MDTAFCAALAEQRAAPADPLAVHGVMDAVEDLVAAVGGLIDTCTDFRVPNRDRMQPDDYFPTHCPDAAADVRTALAAVRAALNAEGAA